MSSVRLAFTARVATLVCAAACVIAIAGLASLASPPAAQAFAGPNPVLDPTKWTDVLNLLKAPPVATSEPVGSALVAGEVAGSGVVLPGFSALGIGLLIGGTADHYFHISCRIGSFCSSTPAGGHNIYFVQWDPPGVCTGGQVFCAPLADRAGYYYARFHQTHISWTDSICCDSDFYSYDDPNNHSVYDGKSFYQDAQTAFNAFGVAPTQLSNGWYGIRLPATASGLSPILTIDASAPHTTQPYQVYINPNNFTTNAFSPAADSIRDALMAGDDETDVKIGQLIDPGYEGEEFEWSSAEPLESYSAYLARLRTAGWLGTATVVTLQDTDGDPDFGASGVPCTSVASGAVIGSTTPVTIYKNATTFGSGYPSSGGPNCNGRLQTTQYGNRCRLTSGSWDQERIGLETEYDAECVAAWTDFWANQPWFSPIDGTVLTTVGLRDMFDATKLGDTDLLSILDGIDPVRTHWIKGSTPVWTTPNGNDYEIHFYRNTSTGLVYFDIDWKAKFRPGFTP